MDTNTYSLLLNVATLMFFGWIVYLVIRTDKNDATKARAEGFKQGVEHADRMHESRMATARQIEESKTRRIESEHRHEQFMHDLDGKYPEVSRAARERDDLARQVEELTARLEQPSVPAVEEGDIVVESDVPIVATDAERAVKNVVLP